MYPVLGPRLRRPRLIVPRFLSMTGPATTSYQTGDLRSMSPLSELPLGAQCRIAEIRGGRQLTHRLRGLGLRVGSEVEMLHRRGNGVVLSVGDTRVALGAGVAEKLFVVPLEGPGVDAAPPDPSGLTA